MSRVSFPKPNACRTACDWLLFRRCKVIRSLPSLAFLNSCGTHPHSRQVHRTLLGASEASPILERSGSNIPDGRERSPLSPKELGKSQLQKGHSFSNKLSYLVLSEKTQPHALRCGKYKGPGRQRTGGPSLQVLSTALARNEHSKTPKQ